MQSTPRYAYSLPNSENVIDLGSSGPIGSSSSTTSHYYSVHNAHKRRKLDRACDACRRRKSKCDGPKMPDNVCTNCRQTKKTCTYLCVIVCNESILPFPVDAHQGGLKAARATESVSQRSAIHRFASQSCQLCDWTRRQNGEVGIITERGTSPSLFNIGIKLSWRTLSSLPS